MSRGSQVAASEITDAMAPSGAGRAARTGRSVGSAPSSTGPRRTQTSTPSSYAA